MELIFISKLFYCLNLLNLAGRAYFVPMQLNLKPIAPANWRHLLWAALCAVAGRPASATGARFVRLRRHETMRLEKSSGVKRLEVREGIVWLTGTPGKEDVLLQAGDHFEPGSAWPCVIEALEPAELVSS